jgi:hypothetical protein
MPTYKAPVRDMRFLMNEVFDFERHYKAQPNGEEATPDMVEAIIGEMAKLCENTIAPLYQSGDEEGCKLEDGVVTTPEGFQRSLRRIHRWRLARSEPPGRSGRPRPAHVSGPD